EAAIAAAAADTLRKDGVGIVARREDRRVFRVSAIENADREGVAATTAGATERHSSGALQRERTTASPAAIAASAADRLREAAIAAADGDTSRKDGGGVVTFGPDLANARHEHEAGATTLAALATEANRDVHPAPRATDREAAIATTAADGLRKDAIRFIAE